MTIAGGEEIEPGLEAWSDVLRAAVAGRRWILIGALSALGRRAEELVRLGAREVLLVGYGVEPAGFDGPVIEVERPAGGLRELAYVLAASSTRDDPTLRRFDPSGDAMVLGPGFFEHDRIWGRPYLGRRLRAWQSLEDKTSVDRLWDDLGIVRARSRVLAPGSRELVTVAAELDLGAGTVWSGERSGRRPADSAELVFWVRDRDQAEHAIRALAEADRGVRVMPYLEGVPCSIHAVVGATGAAVLRPVEMVTVSRPDGSFLFAGTDTWWDPPSDRRGEMRALARRVATHLADRVGYRGAFTIDGVLTPEGFRPTELNPRWGAGLWPQAMVAPLALDLVDSLVASGLTGPMDSLERLVVAHADARRFGGPSLHGQVRVTEGSVLLGRHGSGFVATEDATVAVAQLSVTGPTGSASVTVRSLGDELRGCSLRPLARAGFGLADRMFGTTIGTLSSGANVTAPQPCRPISA